MSLPTLARAADPPPRLRPGRRRVPGKLRRVSWACRGRHPLAGATAVSYPAHYAANPEGRRQLAMTVLYGLYGDIVVDDKHYDFRMPDFARLDDATLAATLNFIVFDLGHAPASVKPVEPGKLRPNGRTSSTVPRCATIAAASSLNLKARKVPRRAPALPILMAAAVLAAPLATAPATASPAQDYMLYCMGCHGAEAGGVPGKVPPLAGSLALFMRTPAGRDYVLRVPGAANSALSDAQLCAVLNWIAERYAAPGSERPAAAFTPAEVAASRHVPLASVQATRREVIRQLATAGSAPPADY